MAEDSKLFAKPPVRFHIVQSATLQDEEIREVSSKLQRRIHVFAKALLDQQKPDREWRGAMHAESVPAGRRFLA